MKKSTKNAISDASPSRDELSLADINAVEKTLRKDLERTDVSEAELKSLYLGKKGHITLLLKKIATAPLEKRAEYGKMLNDLKRMCEDRSESIKSRTQRAKAGSALSERNFDVTAPFAPNTTESDKRMMKRRKGSLHPLTSVGEEAVRIFESMGFHVVESRRLDDDYNVFEALNIPKGHPARDMWDTFWTEDDLIPIPHTSAMQNRILRSLKPPIREIIVGKCFRNEATDASHEHTFYQLEGMYVDKGITLSDLIGTLSAFVNAFYGKEVKYKIQPSYFPFVEPALEFLIECLVCGQVGCPFCKYSGWIEVIPCGPIHPAVLREGGLNPDEYTGFAWGLGYDRLVMLRNSISDIRHLHSGDLKFLEQFS